MPSWEPLIAPPDGLRGAPRWFLVRDGELLTAPDGGVVAMGAPGDLGLVPDAAPIFVGVLDGVGCWAAGIGAGVDAPDGTWWQPLRALSLQWSPVEWTVAGRAVQLVEWVRTHRFCGRCGTPTQRADAGRALGCPTCGLGAYPRLAPAIIVLVRKGTQALLAHGARWRARPLYSTLAGFVEPGESLEEAVHREVMEEVGVRLSSTSYVASQPWPFPHSVMLGFTAEWESGELRPDGEEILDARWCDADDLPAVPPRPSIARRLIDDWVTEITGRPLP